MDFVNSRWAALDTGRTGLGLLANNFCRNRNDDKEDETVLHLLCSWLSESLHLNLRMVSALGANVINTISSVYGHSGRHWENSHSTYLPTCISYMNGEENSSELPLYFSSCRYPSGFFFVFVFHFLYCITTTIPLLYNTYSISSCTKSENSNNNE